MVVDAKAARDGLLVEYAMDMSRLGLTPPLDPRAASDWVLRGYFIGVDHVLNLNRTVNFGFLAESKSAPGAFVAVIRGTDNILEWVEDAEYTLTPYPRGGMVEAGFYGVYVRLNYVAVGQPVDSLKPAVEGIVGEIGSGTVRVLGHSLGSAIATYLTLDLACTVGSDHISGGFLASPRPGDLTFARLFNDKVNDYTLYNYELDVVPRAPFGFSFSALPRAITISPDIAQARIKFGIDCNHHCICYVSMLDFTIQDFHAGGFDPNYATCIIGPRAAPPQIVAQPQAHSQ